MLQRGAVCCRGRGTGSDMTPCSVVQFRNERDILVVELTVYTHCTTPQHIATHCNTLQHTATHRNTPFAQLRNERDILSVELTGLRQQMHSRDLQISEFQKGYATHEARARAKDSEIEDLHTQLTQLSSAEVRTQLEALYTATHCNTLHHAAPRCTTLHRIAYCSILQHTATYCNILQHTATYCNANRERQR